VKWNEWMFNKCICVGEAESEVEVSPLRKFSNECLFPNHSNKKPDRIIVTATIRILIPSIFVHSLRTNLSRGRRRSPKAGTKTRLLEQTLSRPEMGSSTAKMEETARPWWPGPFPWPRTRFCSERRRSASLALWLCCFFLDKVFNDIWYYTWY